MIDGVKKAPIGDQINPKKLRRPGIKNRNRFSSETYLEMAELSTKLTKEVLDSTSKVTKSMSDSMRILTTKQEKIIESQGKQYFTTLDEIKDIIKENDKQEKQSKKEQDKITKELVDEINVWSKKIGIDTEQLMEQLWNQGELYEKLPDQLKNSVDDFTKVVAEKHGIELKTVEEMKVFREEYGNELERIYHQTRLINEKNTTIFSKMLKGITSISFSLLEKPHRKLRSAFAPLALLTAPITDFMRSSGIMDQVSKFKGRKEEAKKEQDLLDYRKLQRLQAQKIAFENSFDPYKERRYGRRSGIDKSENWRNFLNRRLGTVKSKKTEERTSTPRASKGPSSGSVSSNAIVEELKILNSNFKIFSNFMMGVEEPSPIKETIKGKKGIVIDQETFNNIIFKKRQQERFFDYEQKPKATVGELISVSSPLEKINSKRPNTTQVVKAGGVPILWLYNKIQKPLGAIPKMLKSTQKLIGEDYKVAPDQETVFKDDKKGFLSKITESISSKFSLFGNKLSSIKDKLMNPFASIKERIGSIFGGGRKKKRTTKPSPKDVANIGDLGALLINNTLLKILKNKDKGKGEKGGGFLSNLFDLLPKGLLGSGLLKMLGSGLPILAGIIGTVWAIMDGITAMGNAKAWGVSKPAAFIGGFLAGNDTKKTLMGGLKNAGKLALVGLGIGFVAGGPIGAVIGGLVGAAIGGLAYVIGAEKIAKGVEGIKNFFVKGFKGIINFFVNTYNTIKNSFSTLFKGIGDFFTDTFTNIKNLITDKFNDAVEKTKEFFNTNPIGRTISNILTSWKDQLVFNINNIVDFVKNIFTFSDDEKKELDSANIFQKVGIMVDRIFSSLGVAIDRFFLKSPLGKMINKFVIVPIENFFSGISDMLSFIAQDWNPVNMVKRVGGILTGDKQFKEYTQLRQKERQDEKLSRLIETLSFDKTLFKSTALTNLKGTEEQKTAQLKTLQKSFEDNLKVLNSTTLKGTPDNVKLQKETAKQEIAKILATLGFDLSGMTSVEDAIIKPNGNIIRTSPDDTIIATKNTPELGNNIINNKESIFTEKNEYSSIKFDTASLESQLGKKLDVIATILKQILEKENVTAPQIQTTNMLDSLIKGVF